MNKALHFVIIRNNLWNEQTFFFFFFLNESTKQYNLGGSFKCSFVCHLRTGVHPENVQFFVVLLKNTFLSTCLCFDLFMTSSDIYHPDNERLWSSPVTLQSWSKQRWLQCNPLTGVQINLWLSTQWCCSFLHHAQWNPPFHILYKQQQSSFSSLLVSELHP